MSGVVNDDNVMDRGSAKCLSCAANANDTENDRAGSIRRWAQGAKDTHNCCTAGHKIRGNQGKTNSALAIMLRGVLSAEKTPASCDKGA